MGVDISRLQTKIEGIMHGRDDPGTLAIPLAITEAFYRFGVNLRNFLFDNAIFKAGSAPCPVISVGAITMGGAGKTPFARLMAKKLEGKKPGILSRGYKGEFTEDIHVVSDGETLGKPPPYSADEAYMLARSLKGVAVVCAPNRLKGANKIVRLGAEVIILDDGFSHRKIARDLDILIVSADNPFGKVGRLFPCGVLREAKENIVRADLIVISASRDITDEKFDEVKKAIRPYSKDDTPVIGSTGTITGFADIFGEQCAPPTGSLFAFCGVAEPERFYNSLETMGHDLVGTLSFPDHHKFKTVDIDAVSQKAKSRNAEFVVTTEKDAVRLLSFQDAFSVPLLSATYEVKITRGEELLDDMLAKLF